MITVTDRIDLGNHEYINLDARYTDPNGNPFSSVSAAQTYHAGKMNELFIGLTVLVKESGWTEAKEYWVQPKGTTPETYGLVEKGAGTTDYADLNNKPTINNVPLSGNKTASDLHLATEEQGDKADTAIQGVSVNGTEVTPDPTTKKVALIIENGKSAYQLYLDNYEDEHGSTDGALDEAAWLESLQGKSALQIYNETMNTSLDEAGFINVLKQNYPMEYMGYNQTAAEQSIGTAFAAIDQLAASAATAGKLYLMPNDGTTPTGTELFITVQTDATTYMWYRLGALSVPSNVLTEVDIVNNLNTGGADKVPSAEAVKGLNEQLYGTLDMSMESGLFSLPSTPISGTYQNTTDASSTGTNAAWYHEGYAKSSGVIDLRAYKEAGYKYLKVTMNVNESNVHGGGFLTFVKRLDKPQTATSFNDLVANGYLSSVHIDSNHVCINTPSSSDVEKTTLMEIPDDAIGVLFQYKNTSGTNSQATTFRKPKEVKCAGLIVGGDINDLKKETTDSETIGEKVGLLESTVDVPYNEVDCEYEVSDGYVNGITGVVTSHSTLRHVETTVSGISRLKFLGYELTNYTGATGYAFYDENDTPISYAKYDVNLDVNTRGAKAYIVDVPDGAVTFRCTIGSFNSESFSIKAIEGDTVTEWVSKENLLVTTEIKKEIDEKSYRWTSLVTGSVLKSDGTLQSGLSENQYGYTQDIIAVKPGDVLTAYFYYINESGAEVVATNITDIIRSVCCYRNNEVMSGGFTVWTVQTQTTVKTSAYTVPFGCDGVKITFGGAHSGFTRVKLLIERQGEKEFFQKLPNNDSYNQFRTIEAMNAGVKYALPYADVWSNKVIVFSAKVTPDAENGIGTLTIGNTRLRTATWGSNPASITINDTTITTNSGISEKQNGSWQHGLTINNDIQVIIETDRSYNQLVKITLRSNGQEDYVISGDDFIQPYTDPSTQQTTNVRKKWGQVSGARYAQASISGVFSEVSFSNIFKDLLSPVWIFGDSYCSNNGDSRWVYWAEEANVKNYLLSSFAGATSEDQIVSFRSLIAIHRPKVVCWFLGMNDPDSTGSTQSSTPDSSWLSCVKEVIETCDRYGVQVVLATIPSVQNPTGYGPGGIYSNKAKNDWVRASGKRFYDEEAAVGATSDGWWIGVSVNSYGSNAYKETAPLRETTDNPPFGVHPSTNGAKALFTRLLADVPEIMF